MRPYSSYLLRAMILSCIYLTHWISAGARTGVRDIQEARDICDSRPLTAPEGIWLYPDDQVTVLIFASSAAGPNSLPQYDITVVDSSDVRMSPGTVIGKIESTPDVQNYKMTLFTSRKGNIPVSPRECLATLDKDGDVFYVKGKKLKIRFNPMSLLPRFWRIARISTGNPLQRLPAGMVRIYPSYDGNGSSRRSPRVL